MSYSPKVAKYLVEKYGFVAQPDGTVVSPNGYTENEAGQTVKYTAPTAPTTPTAPVVVAADPITAGIDPVSTVPVAPPQQETVSPPPVFSGGSPKATVNPSTPSTPSSVDSIVEMLESMTTKVGKTKETRDQTDNSSYEYNYGDGTTFTKNGNSYGITLADGTKVSASKDLGLEYGQDFGKGVRAGTSINSLTKALQNKKIEELGEDNPGVIAFRAKQEEAARLQKIADDRSDDRQAVFQQENLNRYEANNKKQQGDGFLTDLAGAGGSLMDLGGNILGGLGTLVDKGKEFFGGTPSPEAPETGYTPPSYLTGPQPIFGGAVLPGQGGGPLDLTGFEQRFDTVSPLDLGGFEQRFDTGGGSSSDDVYQDAILRGGTGASGPAQGTDDSGFTSGVLPSSVLGEVVSADLGDNPFSPNYGFGAGKFLQENDSEWFEDWNRRRMTAVYAGGGLDGDANLQFMDELQGRFDTFLTGERGGRGPTVTVGGETPSGSYDDLDGGLSSLNLNEVKTPGSYDDLDGMLTTLGQPGQLGGGSTYDDLGGMLPTLGQPGYTGGGSTYDDLGGGGGQGGDQSGGDDSGGEVVVPDPVDIEVVAPEVVAPEVVVPEVVAPEVVVPDPVDPDPVDPDPVVSDPDDPFAYDPIAPFVPSNIAVPSFLQPGLVPYLGNQYASPNMDFLRANQVNPFADPYANIFVARNGGIVSLR